MHYFLSILLLNIVTENREKGIDNIVQLKVAEIKVSPGENGVIEIDVTVKKGYHIQANKVEDEFIIPTTLEIITTDIITTDKPFFPAGKRFRLKGTKDHLLVYDGNFKIRIPFRTGEKLNKGKYKLDAKLHYQACDSKTCFFPKAIVFFISVSIV